VAQKNAMTRGNLPQPLTQSSGRENGIAQVTQLLESNPLVTILDDDDTLALTVGAQLADQFSDGVWWVDLGAASDPTQVLETVALTLDIDKNPHRSLAVSLIEHLREKNLLLILDHCDHVLGTCAQFAETILHTCQDVRILTTGRQPLNISVAKHYRVVH
jgi:non-specific serine/threonine protein kinase